MTATVSPFRRLQDAHAALLASGHADAAYREYVAAEQAAKDYVLTPREKVERYSDAVTRESRTLADEEAAGIDTATTLDLLGSFAEALGRAVRTLQEAQR